MLSVTTTTKAGSYFSHGVGNALKLTQGNLSPDFISTEECCTANPSMDVATLISTHRLFEEGGTPQSKQGWQNWWGKRRCFHF